MKRSIIFAWNKSDGRLTAGRFPAKKREGYLESLLPLPQSSYGWALSRSLGCKGLERVILGSCHKRVFKRRQPNSFVQTPSHPKEKPVKKTERGEKCLERQLIRWPCGGRQQNTWNWMLEGLYIIQLLELCRNKTACWGQCLAEEWRSWQIVRVGWIRRYIRSLMTRI